MINCYVLTRTKRPDIYLDPYLQQEKLDQWGADEPVCLKSGGNLTKQQKDEASYSLYASIDFAVDRWIQDKQYIPRLLVSALVFLLMYFFLSLVIRDPIPMVDELVISSALTILTWVLLSRRDTRSSVALKRRYELKQRAGSPTLEKLEGLLDLESFLEDVSHFDSLDLCEALCLQGKEKLPAITVEGDSTWVEELSSLLQLQLKTYKKSLYKIFKRVEAVRNSKNKASKLPARLFHLSMQQKLDLGLLSLVVALDEQFGLKQ
ncbi:hypothetical protein SpiGrapes_2962 [Sphaerochaeta pleomorpha str. Grapes]|uniref:Uncharacterized protein n=1 Tax=Sphaerochaeta pleomorpha (strain ATCC BAA-1885 / DSM 22778 / Grapes) TaxID=158190 RepID=G8QXR8_SPHPG|nr:hypothetical protein [Sphaerochaeta pleomorpha]AEV30712.1 hypothetical protein SpiGrapes_2962 [Sphaerochaeta pleomorpha str. Grapes]